MGVAFEVLRVLRDFSNVFELSPLVDKAHGGIQLVDTDCGIFLEQLKEAIQKIRTYNAHG